VKKLKTIRALLGLLVSLPIWVYILHSVLVAIEADQLTMFLFWVYIPVTALVGFIGNLIDE